MLQKLSSPCVQLNYLAGEIALLLERLRIPKLVLHHLQGKRNVEADWLSRPDEREGQVPPPLLHNKKLFRLAPLARKNFTMPPPGTEEFKAQAMPVHNHGVFDSL